MDPVSKAYQVFGVSKKNEPIEAEVRFRTSINKSGSGKNLPSPGESDDDFLAISPEGWLKNLIGNFARQKNDDGEINIIFISSILDTPENITLFLFNKMEHQIEFIFHKIIAPGDGYERLRGQVERQFRSEKDLFMLLDARRHSSKTHNAPSNTSPQILLKAVCLIKIIRQKGQLQVEDVQIVLLLPEIPALQGMTRDNRASVAVIESDIVANRILNLSSWLRGEQSFHLKPRNEAADRDYGANSTVMKPMDGSQGASPFDRLVTRQNMTLDGLKIYKNLRQDDNEQFEEPDLREKTGVRNISLHFYHRDNLDKEKKLLYFGGTYRLSNGEIMNITDVLRNQRI